MQYDSVTSFSSAQILPIKNSIILLILGLLLNSCYSNKSISVRGDSEESLDRINRRVSKKTVHIELTSERHFTGKRVHVTKDSTFWWDAKKESKRYSVATSEIKSISTYKRNTLEGLGYGLLIGATFGVIISQTGEDDQYDCSDAETICFSRSDAAIVFAILFSPPFGLVGLISGAATKTSETYQFKQSEKEP